MWFSGYLLRKSNSLVVSVAGLSNPVWWLRRSASGAGGQDELLDVASSKSLPIGFIPVASLEQGRLNY